MHYNSVLIPLIRPSPQNCWRGTKANGFYRSCIHYSRPPPPLCTFYAYAQRAVKIDRPVRCHTVSWHAETTHNAESLVTGEGESVGVSQNISGVLIVANVWHGHSSDRFYFLVIHFIYLSKCNVQYIHSKFHYAADRADRRMYHTNVCVNYALVCPYYVLVISTCMLYNSGYL